MYVAYLHNEIVAMCAILPLPNGAITNAWRIHRLVVLPDYQGLGIGIKFLEEICKIYTQNDLSIYIRTSHKKLYNHCSKNENWVTTNRNATVCPSQINLLSWKTFPNRIAYSYKYVGKDRSNLKLILNKKENEKFKKISIFDILEEDK